MNELMTLGVVGEAVFGLFALFMMAVSLACTVFWIWMIIDCATKESDQGNEKIIWILIIVLTHLIGALIYFFIRRPQRMAQLGR